MGSCVLQNYFLLPLSNKSIFLYRCILKFDLTTVRLCLVRPGKVLYSQLPSAKSAMSMNVSFQRGEVCGQITCFLLDQPVTVQTSKLSCRSIWRKSNCLLVHDMWKWGEEKYGKSECKSFEAPLVAARAVDFVIQPFILGYGCCHLLLCYRCAAVQQLLLKVVLFSSVQVLDKC